MPEDRQILRLFTLDPLHIGVGQDIMGEVDLPIDRESETGVPRIPGTALKGGFRAHASWKLKMDGKKDKPCPGDQPAIQEGETGMSKGSFHRDQYCGITTCPICQTFGSPSIKLKNKDGGLESIPGHEGRVSFRDARLAFFPAATNQGTVWFSTPGRAAAWLDLDFLDLDFPELLVSGSSSFALWLNQEHPVASLKVGWISISGMKTTADNEPGLQQLITALRQVTDGTFPTKKYWQHIISHCVLLDESNFYRVVETCLERRTCNRVDQDTGTVASGALFSYEALPRTSLLYSRMYTDGFLLGKRAGDYASPLDVCELACEGFSRMGIGGMQTRGLGSLLLEPFRKSARGKDNG